MPDIDPADDIVENDADVAKRLAAYIDRKGDTNNLRAQQLIADVCAVFKMAGESRDDLIRVIKEVWPNIHIDKMH